MTSASLFELQVQSALAGRRPRQFIQLGKMMLVAAT